MKSIERSRTIPCASVKRPTVVVLGLESVGKSSLLSALTGHFAESSALAGTTVRCEHYPDASWEWVDTPGMVTGSDAATVRDTLVALDSAESVLLVLRAHRAREELAAFVPMVGSRRVAVVLTFKDRLVSLDAEAKQRLLATWEEKIGSPVALLNGRAPKATDLAQVRTAVMAARPLIRLNSDELPAFPEAKRRSCWLDLERALGFTPVSLLLLFCPAWVAVTQANAVADHFYDSVGAMLDPALGWLNALPQPIAPTES